MKRLLSLNERVAACTTILLAALHQVHGQFFSNAMNNLPPNGAVEAFPVPMPMPMQIAVPGVVPVFCARKPRPPSCPPCPPCLCVPSCTPAFFAYCSPCHQKCRCRDGMPPPVPLPPVPPIPAVGPAFPLPVAAPPSVMLVPIPPFPPTEEIKIPSCPHNTKPPCGSRKCREESYSSDSDSDSTDDSDESWEWRRHHTRRSNVKHSDRKQRKHKSQKKQKRGRGKMRLRRNLDTESADISIDSDAQRSELPTWRDNRVNPDDSKPVLAYVNKDGQIRIEKRISADDVEHIKRGVIHADAFKPVLAYVNGHGQIKVDKRISANDAAKLKKG